MCFLVTEVKDYEEVMVNLAARFLRLVVAAGTT